MSGKIYSLFCIVHLASTLGAVNGRDPLDTSSDDLEITELEAGHCSGASITGGDRSGIGNDCILMHILKINLKNVKIK